MNEETLFHEARQKPVGERAAFLDEACGDDDALRARVESLLQADDNPDSLLEPKPPATSALPALSEAPGQVIGPYKLLEQIGEGGMGVVYMADQQKPVRRRVALKIIKTGMDTRQVVARFEAERQALALMDHANIARVLDAGATDSGRPYFVMELVRGVPITEYCDQNNLPVHERLELFVQVCHAVQHAHQKGIIHRDIKPTNVLVTLNDGRPVPKVIDFGVAKATNQQLTEKTLFTAFAQMVGTPLYMSPEQAEMSSLDIDTRSDIYSLGVLLYELLTGTTPFDKERLRAAAYDEMRRIIREEEPPRPSTRISTSGEARTAIAAHRHVESRRLGQLVEGDLDWIVMKSLDKDRQRRYETASALVHDIQRHLSDQPVEARPPSNLYRCRKFVRRNRVGVLAGAAIVAAVIVGMAVSIWSLLRAESSQARALVAELKLRIKAEGLERLTATELFINQKQMEKAQKKLDEVDVERMRESPDRAKSLLSSLGYWHVRNRQWTAATANFGKLIELEPLIQQNYHALGPLLVQAGDMEGYAEFRRQAIAQFGHTTNRADADRTAKDCLILPIAGPELGALAGLVQTANEESSDVKAAYIPWFQCTKGLAEYRQGHYQRALDWMAKSAPLKTAGHDMWRYVQAHSVMAIADFRLGDADKAQSELAMAVQAEKIAPPIDDLLGIYGMPFADWIIAHVLLNEAQTILGTKDDSAADTRRTDRH